MILQRYTFGSKSQPNWTKNVSIIRCLWYCKDIHLEANHNPASLDNCGEVVAYDIAKIYIWKQITTAQRLAVVLRKLLMILQRYTFGSKSQQALRISFTEICCLWYCKDIHLEANHNPILKRGIKDIVAYDIAKIYIWKQITTLLSLHNKKILLLMILQRYTFGSKSQLIFFFFFISNCCLWYCKDIHLEANHNNVTKTPTPKEVVYDIAKIYIWKQITTKQYVSLMFSSCLWYCKDR